MKITGITVLFIYEDGSTHDVSSHLPSGISNDLEDFADSWEEEYGKEENGQT